MIFFYVADRTHFLDGYFLFLGIKSELKKFSKVHKFWEDQQIYKTTHTNISNVKKVGSFFQIFMAFSKYLNFPLFR